MYGRTFFVSLIAFFTPNSSSAQCIRVALNSAHSATFSKKHNPTNCCWPNSAHQSASEKATIKIQKMPNDNVRALYNTRDTFFVVFFVQQQVTRGSESAKRNGKDQRFAIQLSQTQQVFFHCIRCVHWSLEYFHFR